MPNIRKLDFNANHLADVKAVQFGKNWPIVYVLENGTEAYIGESTDASTRFKQHYQNPERRKLTRAYVIGDEEYNKSATQDIESMLIQYMSADGVFKLQNGNAGLANHQYFEKEKYTAKFESIWDELRKMQLAKHDLLQLRNLDIFKYSPYKALTDEQFAVVDSLFENIKLKLNDTFLVHGEPGTGKTILAVYMMKFLVEQEETKNMKIALVVPMTGLRATLKKVFRRVKNLSPNMVIGASQVIEGKYELLLIDEAHRLRRRVNLSSYPVHDKANTALGLGNEGTELDWIIACSKFRVLFYDERQTVRPSDIRPETVKNLRATEYRLTSQLRVKGGEDYLRFVDELLSGTANTAYTSNDYDFRVYEHIKDLQQKIADREKEGGLARVVAGYAWPWLTKDKSAHTYDFEIEGQKFIWNSTTTDWVNSSNAVNEVGCIHTIQGYDLNYVGVIFGAEISYDPITKKIVIDQGKYKDINGKRAITHPEELEAYIINIYKTLMTRGIKGCYVYCVNEELGKYFHSLIGMR